MIDIEELELQLKISELQLQFAKLKNENIQLRLKNGIPIEEDISTYADIGLVGL